jgi:hypothetical protein
MKPRHQTNKPSLEGWAFFVGLQHLPKQSLGTGLLLPQQNGMLLVELQFKILR